MAPAALPGGAHHAERARKSCARQLAVLHRARRPARREGPGASGTRGELIKATPSARPLYARRSPLALRLLARKGPAESPSTTPSSAAAWKPRSRRSMLSHQDGLRLVHGDGPCCPASSWTLRPPASPQTLSEGHGRAQESLAKVLMELTGATRVVCRDDASAATSRAAARVRLLQPRATRYLPPKGEHAKGGPAGGT